MDQNKIFKNVVGHKEELKEIVSILTHLENYKFWNSKGVTIPKGILLNGGPGNGKSLIVKEIIDNIDIPTYVFKGNQINLCGELEEIFLKAHENDQAIVVIDEIDLLIEKENKVVRVLQDNLDGIGSKDGLLLIACTNSCYDIPDALLRNGRLETVIKIRNPNEEEIIEHFYTLVQALNIEFLEELDNDEVIVLLENLSYATIKAIMNDVVLKNGFKNISKQMIYDSVYRITCERINRSRQSNYETAIHEAGHALMALNFSNYFKVIRLSLSYGRGVTITKDVEPNFWSLDKVMADIQISLAGTIAQKLIFKQTSFGCEMDLNNARSKAERLIKLVGSNSIADVVEDDAPFMYVSTISDIKRRKNEINVEKILKKSERIVKRYISKHKKDVLKIGDELFKKQMLSAKDIECLLSKNGDK